METCDFLIIGAGVIGINVAVELSKRFPRTKVITIEKEASEARHASGRNSGVLHAGFYYTADSLKAKFTKEGNAALTAYCDENRLPIRKCGKLIVAPTEREVPVLDVLMERAIKNGVRLEKITEEHARKIEPKVKTTGFALYSPTTSSVDPHLVVKRMRQDAAALGVDFRFGVRYRGRKRDRLMTSDGLFSARYVINTAGLYADKIAQDYGFSKDYYLLPFKGLYLYSTQPRGVLSTNIYPVPNLANPFLRVHFTVTVDGSVKLGPTAIPVFWREQYHGLDNFRFSELIENAFWQTRLFLFSEFMFHRFAFEEIKQCYKPYMIRQAALLADGFSERAFGKWGKPGIRAQLVNRKSGTLEMDFVLEGDERSMHVLNAVSPAFTCSIPFSRFVVDRIESVAR